MQELKASESAYFITLTYDEKHAPTDMFGNLNLSKRDLQNFIKRLRKAHTKRGTTVEFQEINNGITTTEITRLVGDKSIKYFAVGEYGSKTHRPHYHIILFNARIELIQDAWGITDRHGITTEHLGQVNYGDTRGVCEAAIGYCFKYLQKQNRRFWQGELREREFSTVSKGVGISYLTEATADWHAADVQNRMHLTLNDGKKISMPRYYKDKIFFDGERSKAAKTMIEKLMKELSKETEKEYKNRKAAIEGAYKKMYKKYLQTAKL